MESPFRVLATPHRRHWLGLFLLLAVFVFLAGTHLLTQAADDARLLRAVNVDEDYTAWQVGQFGMGWPRIETLDMELAYPHLFHNISIPALGIMHFAGVPYFKTIALPQVVVAYRLVELLLACGVLALVFGLALRLYGARAAWLSVFSLLLLSPDFIVYAVTMKPDMLVTFTSTLAVFALCCGRCEATNGRYWVAAGATAGLAFASKFYGLETLVVTVVLAVLAANNNTLALTAARLRWMRYGGLALGVAMAATGYLVDAAVLERMLTVHQWRMMDGNALVASGEHVRNGLMIAGIMVFVLSVPAQLWRWLAQQRAGVVIGLWFLTAIAFIGTYLVASPWQLYDLRLFKTLVMLAQRSATGHFTATPYSFAFAYGVLTTAVGLMQIALGVIAATWLLLYRKGARAEYILLAWVAVSGAFLLSRTTLGPNYFLPMVPALFVLGIGTFLKLLDRVTPRYAMFIALALLALGNIEQASKTQLAISQRLHPELYNQRVAAGLWLRDTMPASSRVMADSEIYVPASFTNFLPSWSQTIDDFKKFKPDVIVTSNVISDVYEDANNRTGAQVGPELFDGAHAFYQGLRTGKLGFCLVKEYAGTARIYRPCSASSH